MRCFLAYDIPAEVRDEIVELQKKIRFVKGKFVEKENLHITYAFLTKNKIPNIPDSDLEKIINVLGDINPKSFEMELKGIELIPNENFIRVIAIGTGAGEENFISIQRELDSKLRKVGIEANWHPPHLTLMRVKQVFDRKELLKLIKRIEYRRVVLVDHIKLKKSILRPEGPIYEDIYIKKFRK